jgi:4-alpha-glucanotransferase
MSSQSAPRNALSASSALPAGRQAGVSLHITSLPGPCGIGEIGPHARQFVDTLRRMEVGVWQFLPTGPTAYGDSPYQPLSSFAGNEMFISIAELIDMQLLSDAEASELTTLPSRFVDYGALIPIKTNLLRLAAQRFDATAQPWLADAYADFVASHDAGWLHDYALFRILKSRHGERPWPEWRPEYVHRDADALAQIEANEPGELHVIKVLQFLFHHQWQKLHDHARDRGITLFGDMPIYIALDSSDAWANRDILLIDEDGRPEYVAGVPPDYFSEDGQLWGNPLYDWEKHEKTGYSWWIDRLRAAAGLADIVRIDHFRGFEAYWSIPADSDTARNGTWEPGPADGIFDAMSQSLGALPIVAEDLGVITPEVNALRDRHHIPGMRVLQFDVCEEGFQLSDIGSNSVCYTGTHDNDTTIGWFNGSPNDIRSDDEIRRTQQAVLQVTGGTPQSIHLDLIRAALSTKARIAVAPMQDFLGLGSEARINTPGRAGGNWRWRVLEAQLTPELCDNVASLVRESGRELPR